MNTPTLNTDFLQGIEPNTEEMGVANLKIIMDFALDTIDDICFLAAFAHEKGESDTAVVGYQGLIKHIAYQLNEQSTTHAEMFAAGAKELWPHIIKFWLDRNKFNYMTSDLGLWIDIAGLREVMAAQES